MNNSKAKAFFTHFASEANLEDSISGSVLGSSVTAFTDNISGTPEIKN